MTRSIQLVIPMSGVGRRFISAGYSEPKPLIEVDGKPIIEHVVGIFPGIKDVIFICNEKHLRETEMREILMHIVPTCKVVEVPDTNRRGPVDAVYQAKEYIKDDSEIIVSYCDYGTVWDFKKFLEETKQGSYDGMIACYRGFHPHMLGGDNYAFCKVLDNKLVQIKEKEAFTNNKMAEYASNGTYYFNKGSILKKYFKEAIDKNITLNGEFYVSLVYNLLVEDNLNIGIFEINKMLQWGTPYDLENYKSWSKYFTDREVLQEKTINPAGTVLILPMAGKGSRFTEQNYSKPKPLLDVDGAPMVVRAVDCIPSCDRTVFVCLQEHLDEYNLREDLESNFDNITIIPIIETTEGQACTCEIGINALSLDLNTPIQISACDNGVTYNEKSYKDLVNDSTIDVIVWSFRNNQTTKTNPNMYSWLEVDDDDNILSVSCKKFTGTDPLKSHAIIGTMFFRKASFFIEGLKENYSQNTRTNNEFYVDDVINRCIESGLKVKVFEVDNYICWGTPDDYRTYNYWLDFFKRDLKK